jgi:hypothetical protein
MKTLLKVTLGAYLIGASILVAEAQIFSAVRIAFESPLVANVPGSAIVTSRGSCNYPYPQSEQPPDFVLLGNTLSMTVYLRPFGDNIIPVPPCVDRVQSYEMPTLPAGTYQMDVAVRYLRGVSGGGFSARVGQGSFNFEVASAVPITHVNAINGWGLALLMLGLMGVARWASGVSAR